VAASRIRWEQRGGIAKEVGTPWEQRDGIWEQRDVIGKRRREQRDEEAGAAWRHPASGNTNPVI
jgi:hypothetical protein